MIPYGEYMIEKNPPGLLSRRTFPIDQGRWVMHEEWDITVPGCPMIRNPWGPTLGEDVKHIVRQVVMTAEEHRHFMSEER